MKLLLFFIGVILLSSCGNNLPSNPEKQLEWVTNACLPTAITMKHGLRNATKWNEILIYEYTELATGLKKGHAVCVYIYPVGSNQLWAYDYEGSTRIRAYITDPITIAQLTEQTRGRITNNITSAYFVTNIEDFGSDAWSTPVFQP